jgi:hypothetical protein
MTIPNETRARIVGMCQGGIKGVEIATRGGGGVTICNFKKLACPKDIF